MQHSYLINNGTSATKNLFYAAMGDSLTAGVGVDKYEESYPYVLAGLMAGDSGKITLEDFSRPGGKTVDLINNYLEEVISEKPDIITLLIGVNDIHGRVSAEDFKKNYDYILSELTKKTNAEIYAISIPAIGSDTLILPPFNYYYDYEARRFNKIIESLAKTYNLKYIDLYSPTARMLRKDGPYYSVDSFHPSASGYKFWAEIIYDDINR